MDVTIAFREGEGSEGAEARAATAQGAVSDLSLVADVVQQSPVLRAAIGVGDVAVTASDMQALVQVSRNEQVAKYSEQEGGGPAGDTTGSALSAGTLAGAAVAPLLLLAAILALIQRRRQAGRRRRGSQAQTMFLQRSRIDS